MTTKLFALSAAAAALLVSGCTSSSSLPPSPLNYSAVGLNASGTGTGNGSFSANTNDITVAVDGRNYTVGNGAATPGLPGGLTGYTYADANGDAAYIGGSHAATALTSPAGTNSVYAIVDGRETTSGQMQSLPMQAANYDGVWGISSSSGQQAGGTFQAGANFDSRTVGFELSDQSGLVGGGNGRIIGTGFTSSLNTRGAVDQGPNNVQVNSNNTIDGQFYGPNADEMAGLVRGNTTDGNGATAGYLIGTQ
ncbi:transferrin-binding protein-like solute binding protein [Pelagibacterium nitratireducens]|uniref:Transferrin-binding protein-like solute binding protein n=1 Tax=Pelagibacterium nitratireducens TaxID=1046114 RepID=A0ABZ2I3G0_9HYPH